MKKNKNLLKSICTLTGVTAILLIAGCGNTAPVQSEYYVLSGENTNQSINISGAPIASISRVTLPNYLNQKNIVRRIDKDKIALLTEQLWAEKLTKAIPSIIAEHVAVLKRRPIETHPLPPGIHIPIRIEVNIRQFIGNDETITLKADYRIVKEPTMLTYRYSTSIKLTDQSTQSLVNGYNVGLKELSKDIAKKL